MGDREIKLVLLVGLLAILTMGSLTGCDLFGPPGPPSPTGEATITIGEAEVSPGETATVEISIRVSAGLGLTEIQVGPNGAVAFDPAVIQVNEITGVGGFTVLASTIDNSSGEARFAAAILQGSMISGDIVAIEIEALGNPGESSELELTGIDVLRDTDGDNIGTVNVVNGQVRIGT